MLQEPFYERSFLGGFNLDVWLGYGVLNSKRFKVFGLSNFNFFKTPLPDGPYRDEVVVELISMDGVPFTGTVMYV